MKNYDVVIIGGGPAGLTAAIAAKENGIDSILILERENHLGGILNQCIHNGFGIRTFKENLTGTEYAQRLVDKIIEMKIEYKLDTMVLDLNPDKTLHSVNQEDGILEVKAKSIILATGCRETAKSTMNIPVSVCAGIYTAGAAQKFVNIEGYMPGTEIVILGSGDIGITMARRMTLEGAKIRAVVEIMPQVTGTRKDLIQYLDDFNIPLRLSSTVIDIKGEERIEGVTIASVDENKEVIEGTEEFLPCDTLILSVGLTPENELSRKAGVNVSRITGGPEVNEEFETNLEGIFACGNLLHVYDFVDDAVIGSYAAGKSAAEYVKKNLN